MFVVKFPTFRAATSGKVALLLGLLCVPACGDDTGETPADTTPSASVSDETTADGPNRPNNPNNPNNNPTPTPPANLPPAVPVEGPETVQCGNATCRDRLVGDIEVEPCCVNDECGLDLGAVSEFMPVQSGCAALEQPGSVDATCPSFHYDDLVAPRELPGCCRPDGVCGVVADLSDTVADFGCVDPVEFLSGRGQQSPSEPDPRPGIHLTDGGGFFVSDGGTLAGQCVPRLPEPTPPDAGDVAGDAGDAAASDAAITFDGSLPIVDAATTAEPEPTEPEPDVDGSVGPTPVDSSTFDAQADDAG